MHVPAVELHMPRTLPEAAGLLTRCGPNVRLLAGGTDLLVDLKAGRAAALHLVSLGAVDGLRNITLDQAGLRIGAATTISQLIEFLAGREASPRGHARAGGDGALERRASPYGAILEAARQMAGPQVRNVATVGGNVACGVPCADLPPVLIAMRAVAVAWSPQGDRCIPMDGFITAVRRTSLRPDEILTAIRVPPPPPGFGAAYERFALREGNGIAVASVAAAVELDRAGAVRDACVVLGAVAPVPRRVPLEEQLGEKRPGADRLGDHAEWDTGALDAAAAAAMRAAEPISDIRASAEFRRELVGVLTRRALSRALQRANGDCDDARAEAGR